MSDKSAPSGVNLFWKKLTIPQKLSIISIFLFIILIPIAVIASFQQTRTAPQAAQIAVPSRFPTVKIQNTPPGQTMKLQRINRPQGRIPVSPQTVTAVCLNDNSLIATNINTACLQPKFTWTSDAAGFYVYFGPKTANQIDTMKDGSFQTGTTFIPSNVTSGQTYYLFIQETTGDEMLLWQSAGNIDKNNPYTSNFILKT